MRTDRKYVIGVDYGTDSCRAVLVDAEDGTVVSTSVCDYPRWKAGLYTSPSEDCYRQHPLDYVESLECAVKDLLAGAGSEAAASVRGISFDTTGSTPVLVDRTGTPLALLPEFREEKDAMFILWKDHTAKEEAVRINGVSRSWDTDYTSYSGGTYSAEWVWSKVLHVLRTNPAVRRAAYSWVEHSDWMSALLTGNTSPERMARNRCAAGHKAMWRDEWGGLPSDEFLTAVDPLLSGWHDRLFRDTLTSDNRAGTISREFAARLGLPETTVVGVGAIDAHVGAVGACIAPNVLTRIMGTSTCDILVADRECLPDSPVRGICGQVDGSVLPGFVGFEAGQSAFGDIYAWFKNMLMWPVRTLLPDAADIDAAVIPALSEAAAALPDTDVLSVDWMNGRRTPDADQSLKGAVCGLTLGTGAPALFKSLVEATAFGSRAIVERYAEEGVRIDSIIATGGISRKSPYVMQILSDVLGKPISVVATDQTCALGAAMLAAVAAGIWPDVRSAQKAMGSGTDRCYVPRPDRHDYYEGMYRKYLQFGGYIEKLWK